MGSRSTFPSTKKHPTEPENYYGFTKLEIERILAWYDRLKACVTRPCAISTRRATTPRAGYPGLERNPANLIPVIMEVASGIRSYLQGVRHGLSYQGRHGHTRLRPRERPRPRPRRRPRLDFEERQKPRRQPRLRTGLSVLDLLEEARRATGREIPAEMVGRRPRRSRRAGGLVRARQAAGVDARATPTSEPSSRLPGRFIRSARNKG